MIEERTDKALTQLIEDRNNSLKVRLSSGVAGGNGDDERIVEYIEQKRAYCRELF